MQTKKRMTQFDQSLTSSASLSGFAAMEKDTAVFRAMARFTAIVLAAFYVLALIVDRAAGVLYGLLIVLGLAVLICSWKSQSQLFASQIRRYWPLALAMAAPMFAVLANEISRLQFSGRSIDAPSRLALFALVLWTVSIIPVRYLRHLQWAFVAGTILSTIKAQVLTHGGQVRYSTDFIPITIFIELAMLLGTYSLFSLGWSEKRDKTQILLKVLAAIAILYGSYLSQSRGAWITIPVFAGIALFSSGILRGKRKLAIAALIAIALVAALSQAKLVKDRVAETRADIELYVTRTNVDTPIGFRFQLWHGSLAIFLEHPIFGVGVDKYREALEDLPNRKVITPAAAEFAHSHNEFLFNAARLGLFGIAALLALYLVPAYYFARDLRHHDKEVRAAACMGACLCAGIFVLGLTDVVFLWWEVFPFYAVGVATFITFIDKKKAATTVAQRTAR
ncbi:O-antigen ligase family protein [Cupriavidus sp. WKF15]|uniref:O-antigen ligase family protein n=1 Tax=Cupriavidus sp. WKF15 TaxID=3032282 RepID=UPI0023E301D8|nr:O-antigen ligase family protein [Cupriavidus sp. WKF15]WER45155.1 O-antigen ligase family protein [Cupriavidus sp. WKF15]